MELNKRYIIVRISSVKYADNNAKEKKRVTEIDIFIPWHLAGIQREHHKTGSSFLS